MGLTRAHFERASELEQCHSRLHYLARLSDAQLRALLARGPVEAARWIASAAACGLPAAQLSLGRMFLAGYGVQPDTATAFHWFARAARQGDAEALNMVGRCQELGWGVPVDLAGAAGSYRLSAEAGHDWGQYNLGNLLFDGRGVPQDRAQALRWYLAAARQNHGRAMNLVGRCLEEGWGCVAQPDEAAYWYRCSAQSGYFRGQFNHALVLLQAGAQEQAAHWLWQSALGGNADIRRAIGRLLARVESPVLCALAARVAGLSG